MSTLLLRYARILDPVTGQLLPAHGVLIDHELIVEIQPEPWEPLATRVINLDGLTLMPGLCDAHVHITALTADLGKLRHHASSYVAAYASKALYEMLMRGFTTVRDAGGADYGYVEALEDGLIVGPRLLICGHALSQTGGHGDMRNRGEEDYPRCCSGAGIGRICDGVTEVRRACRDEIRKGAHQIKIMASGGVASPTDRIGSSQFSKQEIQAAVEEASAAGLYVMAHAYTDKAIVRALECGVRSIEHGNLIGQRGIALLRQKGAFLVPTLSTYSRLAAEGVAGGMPKALVDKVYQVLDAGLKALQLAYDANINIAFGSDLLGAMQVSQLQEFKLRSEVVPVIDLIRQATCNAARLFNLEGEIGVIKKGARADLLVYQGNPLENLEVLMHPEKTLQLILKDGVIYKNKIGSSGISVGKSGLNLG